MNLLEIFSLFTIHYIGDFLLQTDEDARGKSTSWKHLLNHTFTYTSTWFIAFILIMFGMCYYELYTHTTFMLPFDRRIYWFIPITFVCHTITDYFTSRWVKKSFDKQDYHNGFAKIGFDQYVLHLPQSFLTYYLLTKK